MTLEDILSKYDSPDAKGFYSHDITGDIKELDEAQRSRPDVAFEVIIHSLQIQHDDSAWGTYLGPMFTGTNADGTPAEYPDRTSITADLVQYAESRMRTTSNPRMRLQYAAVCWDFMPQYKIPYPSNLHYLYFQSLIDAINGDYECHPVATTNHIHRAFALAQGKAPQVATAKQAMRDFVHRHAEDKSVRYWGTEFDIMLQNKKLFTQEERDVLVAEHEARLIRLSTDGDTKIDPFIVQEQATLLADYYKSETTPDNKLRVLKVMEDCYRRHLVGKPALTSMGLMQQVSNIYNKYNLQNESKRLFLEIQQIGTEAPSEMQPTKIEYKPTDEQVQALNAFIDDHSVGTPQEKWIKFVNNHIERKEHNEKQIKHNAKYSPLWAMTPTQMMDEKGRPMSVLGSVEDDLPGHMVYSATQNILFTASIFHTIITRHIESGFFTSDSIMEQVGKSAIIDISRHDIIRHALQFYFSGDYITFCHLIVPQLEEAIRNIVEQSGNAVIKRQKSGMGFQLKTLDEILSDPSIPALLSEDGAFYLKALLTDQKGFNIRNLLCHGISSPSCFNAVAADRLLHCLIMLAMIQYTE